MLADVQLDSPCLTTCRLNGGRQRLGKEERLSPSVEQGPRRLWRIKDSFKVTQKLGSWTQPVSLCSSTGPRGTSPSVSHDELSVMSSVLRGIGLSLLDRLPEVRSPIPALASPPPWRDVAGTGLALCFWRTWHCCTF